MKDLFDVIAANENNASILKQCLYDARLTTMDATHIFLLACREGFLDIVQGALTGSVPAQISANNYLGLREACRCGHLDIVKYLLTSPELIKMNHQGVIVGYADMYAENNGGMKCAIIYGHLDIVEFLFSLGTYSNCESLCEVAITNNELGVLQCLLHHTNADIHQKFPALDHACSYDNLDIVKYLLTSPDLEVPNKNGYIHHNSDIYADSLFKSICITPLMLIVHYLIFDYNIQLTPQISKDIVDLPEIQALFQMRELKEKLNNDLKENINNDLNTENNNASKKMKL